MRMFTRGALIAFIVLCICLSLSALADQLPTMMEKDIYPGTTYVDYAGQTFRFVTSVTLHIKMVPKGASVIQFSFKARHSAGGQGGPGQVSGDSQVNIFWQNWNSGIYEGPPPAEEWMGMLNTESGYTEK